jgi:hypothetical protein
LHRIGRREGRSPEARIDRLDRRKRRNRATILGGTHVAICAAIMAARLSTLAIATLASVEGFP